MEMNKEISLDKKIIIKFFFLSIFFLLIFYFFIFKNILLFNELRENITNENIKLKKLNLEKKSIFEALEDKNEQFQDLQLKLENLLLQNKEKINFSSVGDILKYVDENISKYNLELVSFARSNRNEKNINISLTLKGGEKNIKNFINIIENGDKNINLSKNYFKFFVEKNLIFAKLSLNCLIEGSSNDSNILIDDNVEGKKEKNIFLRDINSANKSFMRIGNKKFFRNIREENVEETKKEVKKDKGKK